MTPNTLSPASVVISLHSAYGAHRMTLPTLAWSPVNLGGTLGSYVAWDSSGIDAEAMINALVDKLKVFYTATVAFDEATIYTMDTSTSPNIPRRSAALTQVGTSASVGYSAAISTTFNFKTSINGNARIVLLDSPLGSGGFAPILPADFDAPVTNVFDEYSGDGNAWSGRDNNQITELRKVSFDLNDKLQKLYHLV